ncbi:MAG: C25 family cysteine peptidase, partial [Acidobacteriota bacterium]
LNGTPIGSGTWDGSTAHQLDLSFDQTLLADGDNTVEVHAPADTGIEAEIFYLEAIDLVYQRSYRAVDDQLVVSAGGHTVVTLEGFTRDDITVLEITEPGRPRRVVNTRIESSGGGFSVSFAPSSSQARYIALPLDTAASAGIVVDQPSNLYEANNRGEYLVIAAAGLEASGSDLAQYRASQGLESQSVRLQDIYDEFNRGVVSPWAIRDFLRHATAVWQVPPRWVVLAGDSSFDFKDRLGFGGNLLPAPMASTPEGLFPSDHRTVDLSGDDGVPEVAVGRLPVRTEGALAAYLAKLQAYEAATGAWRGRTVWVADAVDEGGEFIKDSESLIDLAPFDLDVDRVYVDLLGPAAARQQLLDDIDDGAALIHFLGHGNLMQMGDDAGLLLTSDVPSLTNAERQPILTAMTCALGRYDRIFFDTLSESLVLQDGGGVIALWAPTGFSFNAEAVQLAEGFLPSFFEGSSAGSGPDTLGEAVAESLANYLANAEEPRAFIPFVYTLLGDPVVRLQP